MNAAEKRERAAGARRRVMLVLRSGPESLDQIRPWLKPFGRYGTPPGCKALLDDLVARGAIITTRHRRRPTGPLEDMYRLPAWVCEQCGCDQGNACLDEFGEPCHWVRPDLCSSCAPKGGMPR